MSTASPTDLSTITWGSNHVTFNRASSQTSSISPYLKALERAAIVDLQECKCTRSSFPPCLNPASDPQRASNLKVVERKSVCHARSCKKEHSPSFGHHQRRQESWRSTSFRMIWNKDTQCSAPPPFASVSPGEDRRYCQLHVCNSAFRSPHLESSHLLLQCLNLGHELGLRHIGLHRRR